MDPDEIPIVWTAKVLGALSRLRRRFDDVQGANQELLTIVARVILSTERALSAMDTQSLKRMHRAALNTSKASRANVKEIAAAFRSRSAPDDVRHLK
ncbi:MAG TPA: hypothetical protein VH142_14065, partial [Polyangiaceae bacterium]|nr:hypothetical protein [Polyangiaceae bacterium]